MGAQSRYWRALKKFSVLIFATVAVAQPPFVPAPHKPVAPKLPQPAKWHRPATARSIVGGFWKTDGNFKAAIYLRNVVQTSPLTVTPVLYLSNGVKYSLPNVTLEPAGIAVVDINQGLQSQGIAPWASLSGYVEVDYSWPWDAIIDFRII
jgi:hypothetical protein